MADSSTDKKNVLGNVLSTVVTAAPDVFKWFRDNAKRKKAQAIADTGGYDTLTPYQKSLITAPGTLPPAGTVPTGTFPIQSLLITLFLFVIGFILIKRFVIDR